MGRRPTRTAGPLVPCPAAAAQNGNRTSGPIVAPVDRGPRTPISADREIGRRKFLRKNEGISRFRSGVGQVGRRTASPCHEQGGGSRRRDSGGPDRALADSHRPPDRPRCGLVQLVDIKARIADVAKPSRSLLAKAALDERPDRRGLFETIEVRDIGVIERRHAGLALESGGPDRGRV